MSSEHPPAVPPGDDHPISLPGSERGPFAGARRIADADPRGRVDIAVVVRRAADAPGSPADPAAVAAVERFAREHGLTVTGVNPTARTVGLAGTVADMNAAFGVDLGVYQRGDVTYRGREGVIEVPAALARAVVAILGLDDRPQARPHLRTAQPRATVSYTPVQVADRYAFPRDVTGAGQTIALIELGGGYRLDDLRVYFASLGLSVPSITAVSVDGAGNAPGDPADSEVMLDIEVAGAVARAAAIAVYFAPNTSRGFYDAIAAAVDDAVRRPSVISISWGLAEAGWAAQAMTAYDELFADAAARGVTVFAAAGDDGANDQVGGDEFYVDFPASSPHVVGCGGTRLDASGETVWNRLAVGGGATGGGVSRHFGLPGYQAGAGVPINPEGEPGRGVPDVAGVADPETGYRVRVDGRDTVVGGTSAVAPLWAALTALTNERSGRRAGMPMVRLYGSPGGLRDIVSGSNGGYRAGPGWDACTGLGVPDGERTVALLIPPTDA